MSYNSAEEWSLEELPENLAVLTCTHVTEQGDLPAFVDYNGGHLTVFCSRGEKHEDEAEYRMVALSCMLSDFSGLKQVALIGGYSSATKLSNGSWRTKLQEPWDEEEE